MEKLTFLDYWKQAIALLGVGSLSAFDITCGDYRQANVLEQIDLVDGLSLVNLLPWLDADQQRLLVLLVSFRQPVLARLLSRRSGLIDIDRLMLLPEPMRQLATNLMQSWYLEQRLNLEQQRVAAAG